MSIPQQTITVSTSTRPIPYTLHLAQYSRHCENEWYIYTCPYLLLLPASDKSANLPSAHTAAKTDTYLESKLIPYKDWANDPALCRATERAVKAGIRQIQVSPMQGQFLTILAKGMKAERILEIGTLFGYVSIPYLPSRTTITSLTFLMF
jgi:hypothetical protein